MELRPLFGAGRAAARQDQRQALGSTTAGRAEIAVTPPASRLDFCCLARRFSSVLAQTLARLGEVEVAGYGLDDGEDNWPHDDVVMVADDEEPSPASYRDSRLDSARRGFDPARGRRLGFGSQNIDP